MARIICPGSNYSPAGAGRGHQTILIHGRNLVVVTRPADIHPGSPLWQIRDLQIEGLPYFQVNAFLIQFQIRPLSRILLASVQYQCQCCRHGAHKNHPIKWSFHDLSVFTVYNQSTISVKKRNPLQNSYT